MKIGFRTVCSVPVRRWLLGMLVVGTIIATLGVPGFIGVVVAAPPIDGESISMQGPTSILSTSPGVIRAVVAADLDTDGYADIAFGQADYLRIQPNVGITTTQWAQTVTLGSATYDIRDVHAVDLDRDGATDLVSASADEAGSSQLRVWRNPTSPFTTPWTVSNTLTMTFAISLTSVTSVDLDRNGTPDLVSGGLDGMLRLWSNPLTGTQSFATAWPSPVTVSTLGDQIRQVIVADVDRDGRADIIAAAGGGTSGVVRLWRCPDDPFTTDWTISNTLGTVAATVSSISVGDLDNDGALDVLAGLESGEVLAWHNPLTGTQAFTTNWGAWDTLGDLDLPVVGLAVTDADNDGWLDVVATGSGSPSAVVGWRNTGQPFDGGWSQVAVGNLSEGVLALAAADFDRDGDDDAVTAIGDAGTDVGGLVFWTNALIRSSIRFQTTSVPDHTADALSRASLQGMDIQDINRDGRPDIVVGTLDGSLMILQNDGLPFVDDWPTTTVGTTFGIFAAVAGDLDGDGWPDIVTSSTLTDTGGLVHVWHHDGDPFAGTWVSQTVGTFPRQVMDLALGDVGREGRLQIVASTGISTTIEDQYQHDVPTSDDNRIWLLRPPSGDPFASAWISSTVCTTTYSANSVALGDLDNDGWVDVVFGTDHAPLGTTSWPTITGFFDGPAYQVRACRNLGTPYSSAGWQGYDVGRDDAPVSMVVSYHKFWGAHVWSVAVGDLDRDGYPDVVSGGGPEGDYQILVYKNDGTPFDGAVWAPTAVGYGSRSDGGAASCPGTYPEDCPWLENGISAVNVADLNGDAWPDLVSGFDGSLTKLPVWFNTGAPFREVVTDTQWIRHDLGATSRPVCGVETADLDRDGRLDIAAVSEMQDVIGQVRVWRNLGGIVRHDSQVNNSLSSAEDGATVFPLSFAVTHNGRSYDHDLELDFVRIRAVNQYSQPLNDTTAGDLFQRWRVYRDVNGDGAWQPSDSPVITLTAPFSLDNGYQTLSFPSGDQLAAISPGQTVTYFLALEMQPTASQSSVSRFRLYYTPHEDMLVRDRETQASVSLEEDSWKLSSRVDLVVAPAGSVEMVASPAVIWADGASTSTISATVTTAYGYPVVDDTVITFTTNAGSLPTSPYTSTTTNGIATATLTSGTDLATATVTGTLSVTATGTVGVEFVAGPRASLQINGALGAGGSEVTTHTLSVDDTFTVYVASYDAQARFMANPTDVTWGGTGVVDGNVSPASGSNSTTFSPIQAGTGTITVADGSSHNDATGAITVTLGGLHHIVVRDAAGGGGSEVDTQAMTADDSFAVYAAGYDEGDNYIDDVTATWTGSGVVMGRLSPTSGISTTFTAGPAGTGTIQADAGGGMTDATGTITVNPGALHHVVVRDAAGGGGSEVDTHTMTTDDSFIVYAAGYDADGNLIGDQAVDWATTGTLDSQTATGTSFTFAPTTANTSGTITADAGSGITDATGTITVNPGALHHVVVRDAAGGGGSEVDTHTMTTDDSLTVYAAGYDADSNYIADQVVVWATTGTLDSQTATDSSFTFAPTTANTSGTITADAGDGITDATGTITVNLGALHHVAVRDAADGDGVEVDGHTMMAGDTFNVYAAAYDADDNYIDNLTVAWTGTGVVLGRLAPTSGISTTFTAGPAGTGTIQADAGGGITDTTGTMWVNPGNLHRVVIRDAAGGAGSEVDTHTMTTDDALTVYAAGYDAENNLIGDQVVDWATAGTLDSQTATGSSFTFDPVTASTSGTITADAGGGVTDATGTITVNLGALHHVVIRDAAGGAGTAVDTHTMQVYDTLSVWAAGYDADDNYIADVTVTWTGSGVVTGRLSLTSGISTTFTAGPAGPGAIQADAGSGITDETGVITVNPGVLDHVVIRDAAGGGGDEVDTPTLTVGVSLSVWAAGYDAENNYIDDMPVTWTGTGVVTGRLTPTSGISTTFAAEEAGTGTIEADDGSGHADATGTITVFPRIFLPLIGREVQR